MTFSPIAGALETPNPNYVYEDNLQVNHYNMADDKDAFTTKEDEENDDNTDDSDDDGMIIGVEKDIQLLEKPGQYVIYKRDERSKDYRYVLCIYI